MKLKIFLPLFIRNSLFLFFLLSIHLPAIGQVAYGFQHHEYNGNKFPFAESGIINPSDNFHDNDMISIKVNPGYVCEIFEHPDGGGKSFKVTGQVPDLSRIYPAGKNGHWKDQISSVKVSRLPSGYQNSDAIVSGIYRLRNPYVDFYLRAGYDNTGEKVSLDFTKHQKPDAGDQEYQFAVIRHKNGDYLIFSASTGFALLPTQNTSSPEAGVEALGSAAYGGDSKATLVLKGVGLGRYVICSKDNQQMAVTAQRHNGDPRRDLNIQRLKNEAEQQFEFELVSSFDNVPLPPELDKDQPIPAKYSLLNFVNGETSPHKKKSAKIPFYMVKDPDMSDLKDRMVQNPYYILEREDFIMRKGGNSDGWKHNEGGQAIEFGDSRSNSRSSGSSNSVSAKVGFSSTTSVEADALFVTVSQSFTISAELGYSHSWNSSQSSSIGSHEKYVISPCSKATVYGIKSRIKLKRKNGDIVKTYELFKPGSFSYKEIPLNPEGCPTLRSMGEEKYNNAVVAYNNYVNKHNNGEGAIATRQPVSTPTSTVNRGNSNTSSPTNLNANHNTSANNTSNNNGEEEDEDDDYDDDDDDESDDDENDFEGNDEMNTGSGALIFIESYNNEGYVIGGSQEGAGLVQIGQQAGHSTFKMHGDQTISFELAEYPGNFLKVREGKIIVGPDHKNSRAASFQLRKYEDDVVLLEPLVYPGYFLTISQQKIYLSKEEDSNAFFNTASFLITPTN